MQYHQCNIVTELWQDPVPKRKEGVGMCWAQPSGTDPKHSLAERTRYPWLLASQPVLFQVLSGRRKNIVLTLEAARTIDSSGISAAVNRAKWGTARGQGSSCTCSCPGASRGLAAGCLLLERQWLEPEKSAAGSDQEMSI